MKIIIVAGGTGGHVFPAVCIADGLRNCGYEITFVTDKRGKRYLEKYDANAAEIISEFNVEYLE